MEHKRRRWLIALFAVALFCGTVWLLLPAREPRYRGQPLSHWLYAPATNRWIWPEIRIGWDNTPFRGFADTNLFAKRDDPFSEESRRAIEVAGTKAIPTLLRMLQARDSKLKLKLMSLAEKQHFIKVNSTPALYLNYRAREGFALLGAKASNAVPALIKICDANISSASHLYALDALGRIGPVASNAIPALLRGLESTNALDPGIAFPKVTGNEADRITALWSLGMIHQSPDLVVPALFKAMQDPDIAIHRQAAYALTAYGPEARAAVEPWMQFAKTADVGFRYYLVQSMFRIAPDLAAQMPDAQNEVESDADAVAKGFAGLNEPNGPAVVFVLGALHMKPEKVVPALTAALQDHNINIRREAANALAKFGRDARPAIPALTRALSDTNQDSNGVPVSVFAARALRVIDSEAATNANISSPGKQ